jgi:pyruvate ferredoxin oxidoreductase beta subunit
VEIGKLAVKSGMWVLYEREYGKLTIGAQSKVAMKKPIPLEDYLAPQGRFKGIDLQTVEILRQRIKKTFAKLAAEEAAP